MAMATPATPLSMGLVITCQYMNLFDFFILTLQLKHNNEFIDVISENSHKST